MNQRARTAVLVLVGLLSLSSCQGSKNPAQNTDIQTSIESELVEQTTPEPTTPENGPSQATNQAILHGLNLRDVSNESQLAFVHAYDGHENRYIVESLASGIATLDYDADGLIDIYFLNGAAVPVESGPPISNSLCRNLGGMRFDDVTRDSHTEDVEFSLGVAVADYDCDGFCDLYISNFGRNSLLRNNGDGTFTEHASIAGVDVSEQVGAGVCFLDVDGDGYVDLFVGNYVRSPVEKNVKRTTEGFPSYPGPLDFETDADWLFQNNGDGTFSDITQASGIGGHSSTSMGCVAGDFDDDGDIDIAMMNDVDCNYLFENDGTGKFSESGILRGIAFSHDGKRNGNMGIDCADFDGDGLLDLFTTTFSNELPVLYKNVGSGYFVDETIEHHAGVRLLPHANWGTCFLDVENDRDLDLFIANGHTDPNVNKWAYTTDWKVANSLLVNDGTGRFTDVSTECGDGLSPVESSRGAAAEDFDLDGRIDLIVVNALAKPTLIRNETPTPFHWLQVDLRSHDTSREGIGARVILSSGGKQFIKEVHSGRGYQSSFGQRLHFGLGDASRVEKLSIRWPDGSEQMLENLQADQVLTIVKQSK